MATTSFISVKELERIAIRSYNGRTVNVLLAEEGATGFTEDSKVSEWKTAEIAAAGGYARLSQALGTGAYDAVDGRYEYPAIDFVFTASGGTIQYDTVVIWLDDFLTEAESVDNDTGIGFDLTGTNSITSATVDLTTVFSQYDYVTVSGSASNDGTYEVTGVTTTALTLSSETPLLADEAAGATVTLQRKSQFPYAILQEAPNISIADGQSQTYKISINTDN